MVTIYFSAQILEECPDLLTIPDPDAEEVQITDDMIAQVRKNLPVHLNKVLSLNSYVYSWKRGSCRKDL